MPRKRQQSEAYAGTGTDSGGSVSVPIDLAGIGTRIAALSAEIGTRKSAADAADVSVDSLLRYIRGENMPPFDVAARLCSAAGWRLEWLATGVEPREAVAGGGTDGSQEMSGEHLNVAHDLADEALRGLWLPRRRYYDLVALVYDGITQGLPYAEILAFIRPEAQKMAGGANGGESGVGGKGPGSAG